MSEKVIARRYAKALFESASEKKALDDISSDLELVSSAFESSEDFRNVIHSQVVQNSDKIKIINELFAKKVNGLTLTFLLFLCEKKRISALASVIFEFQSFYKENKGIAEARIESAVSLSKKQTSDIKKYLENLYEKKFEIEAIVNEALIGGFLIRLDDVVIDKSVKYHLEQLESTLLAE